MANLKDTMQTYIASAQRRKAGRGDVLTSMMTDNAKVVGGVAKHKTPPLNPGGASTSPTGKKDGSFESFLDSIVKQESGGNYGAVGVTTRSGDRALGRYQVMGANIPSWSKRILGRSVTKDQFLKTPKLQDDIARGVLKGYYDKYGGEGAAKAWYAGESNARKSSNSTQYGGPSINAYAAKVMSRVKK